MMTWCNLKNPCSSNNNDNINVNTNHINFQINDKLSSSYFNNINNNDNEGLITSSKLSKPLYTICCPSCNHHIPLHDHQENGFKDLPAGVKFDPNDLEVLGHLKAKVTSHFGKMHPLLDDFIPTIEGVNGICYTHPHNLPGVRKDGVMRHFFHRSAKAYTTGTRKRRTVNTDKYDGDETRWHKTGKTRPIIVKGEVKGFKKILVLYINHGRQRKAEKTNWVSHQYHLGQNEEEGDGEFVLSKVFYQTQPRLCGTNIKEPVEELPLLKTPPIDFYQLCYDHGVFNSALSREIDHLVPNIVLQGD